MNDKLRVADNLAEADRPMIPRTRPRQRRIHGTAAEQSPANRKRTETAGKGCEPPEEAEHERHDGISNVLSARNVHVD